MKVFICFVGVFNFFNVTPISFVQNIFKFANIFFTLRAFVGRFDAGYCVVSFLLIAKTIGKWSDKSVFIMANLKSLWPVKYWWYCCLWHLLSVWLPVLVYFWKESYYSETWDWQSLARFYLFQSPKIDVEISCKYYVFQNFFVLRSSLSLKLGFSCTKIQTPPPLQLYHVWCRAS